MECKVVNHPKKHLIFLKNDYEILGEFISPFRFSHIIRFFPMIPTFYNVYSLLIYIMK